MARSRIVTGLEKLMSDLPKLMMQRSLAEDAQMKQLSIAATEGYLKEAANFTTVAQFDAAAASMMDELGPYGNDPTIAMAGNNAFKAMGRLRDNFVNKQEAVVSFNTGFAKAKELNMLDTTSGMQDVYNDMMITFDASKQYFNSTEYSGYKKGMEELAEMIKTKSMFNYLDDLAVGERDEDGNIIVKPGIQSANNDLKHLYEMDKIGMSTPAETKKQLFKISQGINAGTAGAIMNSGAKDMRLLGKSLKGFAEDSLPKAYKNKFLMTFDALGFTEKELTPDNISYVRDDLERTMENIGGDGVFAFIDDIPKGHGKGIEGLESYVKAQKNANPNKPTSEILKDVIDTYGIDQLGWDDESIAQLEHFGLMTDLYIKTGDIKEDIRVANTNDTVDTSISGYTQALGKIKNEIPEESGKQNVLDLVKTISDKQKSKSKPPTQPVVTPKSIPSLSTPPVSKEDKRIADIRVSVAAQEPDQDDMSYIGSIDSKQLKRIGIWSDKNITKGLKTEAKKEIKQRMKELQGKTRADDIISAQIELPKLRKLLKEFNNAGVNTMSKDMLEYMYMLNASQYDGVDDFIASLSDGKIGVE